MDYLKELVGVLDENQIIPRNGSKKLFSENSKMADFYRGLQSGKINSDIRAVQILYGSTKELSKFRKLKSVLFGKLIEALGLFFPKANRFTEYQRAYFTCSKHWSYIKILIGLNAASTAVYLAEKLIKQTTKNELVFLSMDILSYLRIQYLRNCPNLKKYEGASKQYRNYQAIYAAQNQAEDLYMRLIFRYKNKNWKVKDTLAVQQELEQEIRPLLKQYKLGRLHMFGRLVDINLHLVARDYTAALIACNSAILFFKLKPLERPAMLQLFYYEKLVCLIHLREFKAGHQTAQEYLKILDKGTFNWFKFQELYLRLLLHTSQYQIATNVLLEVKDNKHFRNLPNELKEHWYVYNNYFFYLQQLRKVNHSDAANALQTKFTSDFSDMRKDNSGMSTAAMFIKILMLIAEDKYCDLADSKDSLEQYAYRHLNTEKRKRSFWFLKLLLLLSSRPLDRSKIEKKACQYLNKLASEPMAISDQVDEIEIIPYEELWQFALESTGRPA